MIRRLTSLFVLTVFAVTPLAASSVTILLDASFSMSLTEGESTRLDALAAKLRTWMISQPEDTRYALLVAEHGSTPVSELPYPATRDQVSAALDDIVPWGAVDLGASIRTAADLASSIAAASGDAPARLLVASDGEDLSALTGAPWPPVPENVSLAALLLQPRTPAATHDTLAALSEREPLPTATEPRADAEEQSPVPTDGVPQPRTEASPHEGVPAATAEETDVDPKPSLLVGWARLARWPFLGATLLGLAAVWKAAARHRRRVRAVMEHNARPPAIRLEIRGPSGREDAWITDYPAALGGACGGSLHADLADAGPLVRLECEDGEITMSASAKIPVNGVARTTHTIREGNQIRLGRVRVVVRELSRPTVMRPPRPRHRLYPLAPAAAAGVAVVAFLTASLAAPADGTGDSSRAAAFQAATEPADSREQDGDVSIASDTAREQRRPTRATPRLALPDVVAPGEPLPEVDLDYLAVHAHPDDEALDFGALISRMSAAGMRGAVLLLTDGNAGLDQYPWRAVDASYPAYDLSGDELARARVEEAREAIGWLGAELYIRHGLPNHPYSSLGQEVAPGEILDRWGGLDELVDRLRSVVDALQPEIIIAPEGPAGPTGPIEHFEHEATGMLVDRLLDDMDADATIRLALRSVDPLQADGSDGLCALEPYEPGADGTAPRLRQVLALRAHRTQRDATVIGVETRMALRFEYYRIERRARDADDVADRLGLRRVDLAMTRPYPMPERRNQ
ncbi:MAG: PIG-L family deacetylase [Spirochaetota bacterium]